MLSTFWKSKYKKFGFVLKSGYEIKFEAVDLEWKYDIATGIVTSYTITGQNTYKPLIVVSFIVKYVTNLTSTRDYRLLAKHPCESVSLADLLDVATFRWQ